MIDRQNTPSPWSQTMSRIHTNSPVNNNDTESVVSNSHLDLNTSVKIMPLRDQDPNAPTQPRKRNNSLIPVELMMNNSGEGGRECAALATVFGVPEYIDSKIFWERQQYQHEGLLPKKQINPLLLRPSTPSNMTATAAENSKYGYVSVNDISVVSRPLSAATNDEQEEDLLQGHRRSNFFISSYVDSVLDPVGSNELLKPAFLGTTSASAPIPTPTKSFSLPHIPTVSKFNDILIEDEHGVELMFPANPSSILIHSTPILRSGSMSSVHSTYTLPSQTNKNNNNNNNTGDQDDESLKANTRVVVIIGTPEIFDLIVSDQDERFIIWGPDPIVLSSSMATTTTPERPSSYATLYNNQHTRPELKGFSSNTTSTLARSKSIQSFNKNNNGTSRPSFASVRLSAQHWSESLKLARPTLKHSASANDPRTTTTTTTTTTHGSLLLKKAFGLNKNNKIKETLEAEKKSLMDIPKVIEAATIHKLVEKLTITLDYTFMTDFFLTYRDFLDSADLCQLLVSRFYWALENDEESRRIVRIRTFVVLRHWLNNYFVHDFIGNRPLRIILTEFLNRLPRHPLVQTSPRDQRIVKILKRVVRRLKKLYYNRSSGASRVKVIAPPPPTAEQEHMGEIVRAKLSQNVIRRKTALGVDMSSHHNGNMAVQDARYAPVVVVGSLNMKGSFIDSGVDSSHKFLPPQQQPAQDSSDVVMVMGDDSQTIRSSVHHRYDKSVHQPVEAEVGEAKAAEASSVASVASDDSLESELSAGETAPLESDDSEDEDHPLHLGQEYYAEDDEHDRDWIREQQETLEYFKSVSKMALDQSEAPHIDTTDQVQQQDDVVDDVLTESPTSIRPKIPTEFIAAATAITSSPIANPKTVRRVPSERWCKTDDDYHPLHADHALPDELLKELSGDESQSKSPTGLSRKLSRKSIERRKSERSFHDATSPWHSAPSSATTSPYLTGVHSDDQVPELPPLTPEMLDQHGLPKKRVIKKKKSGLKKKAATEEPAIETFASIPYEATQVPVKAASDQEAKHEEQPKRRLSRVLSKVFRPNHHDEDKHAKETTTLTKVDTTREEQKMQAIPTPQQQEQQHQQQQQQQQPQSSQLVSLIAQRLRHSSMDEGDDALDEGECACVKCSGNSQSTANCKRLSVMLIADDERRRSFELRRKRGASIDMDQQAMIHHLGKHANDPKSPKELKSGPVYLGHLQARSLISSAVGGADDQHDSSDNEEEEEEDDASTASFVPSERSIQTEAQASSSRARMSFISEAATSHVPRSKMIELGIPPESNTSLEKNTTRDTMELPPPSSIPRPLSEHTNSRFNGRCFIMSYRTSMLASQLCFIERDVLIKVGWEELIHCKWTKMDSSGNINTAPIQEKLSNGYDEGYDDEKINYTRQTEQRRTEEQGIEQVIQRFNTVCQWVSSEIVRTRNMNERVKLIEKFIRLAKKCKMYSNYATLVQILLGLQSPAVARLEKTWSKVSTKCQKLLSQLTEFTSPMKNWKNIRDSMTEVAEEYGNSPAEVQVEMPGTTANRQKFKKTTRIKIPFGGCIPFLGIYLSDLVFNSEKPRFLKPNLESQRIYSVNNTRNLPPCLDQPLVNFRKHRVIATVIKRVLTFQGLAMRYSFDEDGILLEKCRNLQVLDAAKIRDLSASLE